MSSGLGAMWVYSVRMAAGLCGRGGELFRRPDRCHVLSEASPHLVELRPVSSSPACTRIAGPHGTQRQIDCDTHEPLLGQVGEYN